MAITTDQKNTPIWRRLDFIVFSVIVFLITVPPNPIQKQLPSLIHQTFESANQLNQNVGDWLVSRLDPDASVETIDKVAVPIVIIYFIVLAVFFYVLTRFIRLISEFNKNDKTKQRQFFTAKKEEGEELSPFRKF